MQFKKKIMCVLAGAMLLGSTLGLAPKSAEAADLYSVIYSEVSYSNGNPVECDWITNAILYASTTYGVDPLLVTAIMKNESGFDINVGYSSAGAVGLMQLMPSTAASLGVNPYDPLDNVIGGTIYLGYQLSAFSGWGDYAVTDAVAAYNAGPNAVQKYGGVPPYSETINYVNNVASTYDQLLGMAAQ